MDALMTARAILAEETPLAFDCGKCCGAACCQGGEQDGMLLFPGEERLYENCGWARVIPDRLGLKLICKGSCKREERPLACRIFPLAIRLTRQEAGAVKANIVTDVRAWPVCPLMRSGKRGLKPSFVEAAERAAAVLLTENENLAFLENLSRELDAYRRMKQSFLSGRV